jgi:SNF2 family DNA or RNA helicase
MSSETRIEFDPHINKFLIYTPMWLLDVVRGLPNRRWSNGRKAWMAPAIRMNVAYMREKFPFGRAVWSPAAKQAAEATTRPPRVETIPFPSNYVFKTFPREYQRRGLNKAWGQKFFGLFMEPGTGKTKTTIDLMTARWLAGEISSVLVICPNDVKENWPDQILAHSPIPVRIDVIDLKKSDPLVNRHFEPGGLHWCIIAVESIQASVKAFELAKQFMEVVAGHRGAVVVDESSRIKNPNAVRAQRCADIGKDAVTRLILTGTEITQGIIDLFMQFEFLDPQIIGIGDWYSFRNRYAVMGGYDNKEIVGYQNVEELMDIIRPHVFEVSKKEGLPDLPDKVYQVRTVQMTEAQKKAYKELKNQLATVIEDKAVEPKNVLEKMLRLQEITSGFYSVEENDPLLEKRVFKKYGLPGKDPKIEALMELLGETRGKVVIWSRFRWQINAVAEAIRKKYGDEAVVEFHGGIDPDARIVARKRFQDPNDPARFFVGNQRTGGIGIDLYLATMEIYMANDFSSEARIQSEDRAHRIGQVNQVLYVDFVMEGTVDAIVLAALKQKRDMMEFVKEALREGNTAAIAA